MDEDKPRKLTNAEVLAILNKIMTDYGAPTIQKDDFNKILARQKHKGVNLNSK